MSLWSKLAFWKTKHWVIKFNHGVVVTSIKKPKFRGDGMLVVCMIPGSFKYEEFLISCSESDISSIDIVVS